MSKYHPFATLHMDNEGPAFDALQQAPDHFRQDGGAAVYYVTLQIDATNAHRVEEDMADLKFAFDGFGEAKLYRCDEVGKISTPAYIVAIPDDRKPPHMGALTNRVYIQKLPKESHSDKVEEEIEAGEEVEAESSGKSGKGSKKKSEINVKAAKKPEKKKSGGRAAGKKKMGADGEE